MANKIINTRIQQKHDIEANWLKATNFIPLAGELIIYDPDDNYSYERFKIGDGETLINNLPFAQNTFISTEVPTNVAIGSLWIDPEDTTGGTLLTNLRMIDATSQEHYILYVAEGELTLQPYTAETLVGNWVDKIELIDVTTSLLYKLYVNEGRLVLEEKGEQA